MRLRLRFILLILMGIMLLPVTAQQVSIYNFDQLKPILDKRNDTIYLVNFWATWCKPCVQEMPDLLRVNQKFKNGKFKMILVSLDFDTQLNSKVIPFIQDNHIESEVILLNDSKQNEWIDKVNKEWSGAIPITIIFNKDFYFFREGEISFEESNELITKNLKQ